VRGREHLEAAQGMIPTVGEGDDLMIPQGERLVTNP